MLFPKLVIEPIVQENDKTRLSAVYTFASDSVAGITDILIKPEPSLSFISIYNNGNVQKWFLDWAYATEGDIDIELQVTDGVDTETITRTITIITAATDNLFSEDSDITAIEPSILGYLPAGRSSFINIHREAQKRILAYLDEQKIWKIDGTRFTSTDVYDIAEFKEWSKYQALLIIMEGFQVSTDDIFQEKVEEFRKMMRQARNRAALRLDFTGDGVVESSPLNIRTTRLVRR